MKRCFHCRAPTELRFQLRPVCASAECQHVARNPRLAKGRPLAEPKFVAKLYAVR